MATTAKKPAAKPAAKKTTATKPAAKKTTAAKPAAKKTTAAKPAAKKTTTTAKPAVKSTEISVTGNKKIDTLRKEFNKKFPYLRLEYITVMRVNRLRKVKELLLLMVQRPLHRFAVPIPVVISQSPATRKSSLWKRNLIQYSDCIARFALPKVMVTDTTHRAVMMRRLLPHSMLNVKRTVARRVSGNNVYSVRIAVY